MSTKQQAGAFMQDLPPWAKGALAIGAAFGIYKGIKFVTKKTGEEGKGERSVKAAQKKTIVKVDKDIKKLKRIGKATYPANMYDGWANILYAAMEGVGTDEPKILNVMGYMKNDIDVLRLIKAFGLKPYKEGVWPMETTVNMNLPSWLTKELSDNDIFQINKKLSKARIAYRF